MPVRPLSIPWEVHNGGGVGGTLYLGTVAEAAGRLLAAHKGKLQTIYLDPPYATGQRFEMRMRLGEAGWRSGSPALPLPAYEDIWAEPGDYLSMMKEALTCARELLCSSGTLFLHVDSRMSAPLRLLMDDIFGPQHFLNEIIWTYQTGGRSVKYFSRKHDTILFYRKSRRYHFDIQAVPIPRVGNRDNHMRRGMDEGGRAYSAIRTGGKEYRYYDDEPVYPGDVWADISHLQQKDPQRTGYDTQKPAKLLERILACASRPGDLVGDLFFGSGTTLAVAAQMGRGFIGLDKGAPAHAVARKRLLGIPLRQELGEGIPEAKLAVELTPSIGYYTLTLSHFHLPDAALPSQGPLDAVDQWSAGFVREGTFVAYAHGARTKATPILPQELEIPMLSGQIALLVTDVFGRRQVYGWEGGVAADHA